MFLAVIGSLDGRNDCPGRDLAGERLAALVLVELVVLAPLARELGVVADAELDRVLHMREERLRGRVPFEDSAPGIAERGDHDVVDVAVLDVLPSTGVRAETSTRNAMKS